MLSISLFEELSKIETAIDSSNSLFMNIATLSKNHESIHTLAEKLVNGASDSEHYSKNFRNAIHQSVAKTVSDIPVREVFQQLEYLETIITDFRDNHQYNCSKAILLVQDLSNSYESYLQGQRTTNALLLTETAFKFITYFEGFSQGLRFYTDNYTQKKRMGEAENSLSLVLSSQMTLHEFIQRLESLSKAYKELCDICAVSVTDYPLEIGKIESGSLWAMVFGETKVIELLTDMIRSTTQYMHRTYTKEGKLTSITMQTSSVESVIQLKERMKASGIDTSEMDESLRKSSLVIAKSLESLLDSQANVTLNEETLSIENDMRKSLLLESQILQLQHLEDDDTD